MKPDLQKMAHNRMNVLPEPVEISSDDEPPKRVSRSQGQQPPQPHGSTSKVLPNSTRPRNGSGQFFLSHGSQFVEHSNLTCCRYPNHLNFFCNFRKSPVEDEDFWEVLSNIRTDLKEIKTNMAMYGGSNSRKVPSPGMNSHSPGDKSSAPQAPVHATEGRAPKKTSASNIKEKESFGSPPPSGRSRL
ncbi:hypothetical protein PIB30_059032 [Stylosanthes scabra]|uniref:Uncharacterized protein n=1 Tax=Stylosanthes scabra TaxID=79078 RepID=A0ABU6TLS2_9FABA|nr:hypothetical protein [Stylosanthes scabra]